MKKVCRLCVQEVHPLILSEHSFKCKELEELKDELEKLDPKICSKIEEANKHRIRITQSIRVGLSTYSDESEMVKLEDLSKANRALRKVLAYGEKHSHTNFLDCDTISERELLSDLECLKKEIEEEDICSFLIILCRLIIEKKKLKIRVGKLSDEVKKTIYCEGEDDVKNQKKRFWAQRAASFKLKKNSPKLVAANRIPKSEISDTPPVSSTSKSSKAQEKELSKIDELAAFSGKRNKRNLSGPSKVSGDPMHSSEYMKRITSESRSKNNSPENSKRASPSSFLSFLVSNEKAGPRASLADLKVMAVENNQATNGVSSYLEQNLLSTKKIATPNTSSFLRPYRGPLKATENYLQCKLTQKETSPKPQVAGTSKPRTKRANSLSLFNKFEGEENFELNRFPSLSRDTSPKNAKKAEESQPVASHVSKKPVKTAKFEEDKFHKKITKSPEKKEKLQKQVYDSPSLKGYHSETSKRPASSGQGQRDLVGIDDFDFIKMISKGAYGRVWLIRHKKTKDLYAMKIIDSEEKMNENRVMSLKAEKNVFEVLRGDYVVKAMFTFTHESYICFVMEYMIGGDLGALLEKNMYLTEEVAQFYIGEIISAIEQIHKINIVHRDMKPENILIDAQGHIKLADFGLSQIGLGKKMLIDTPVLRSQKLSQVMDQLAKKKTVKFNQLCDPSKTINKVQYVFNKAPATHSNLASGSNTPKGKKFIGQIRSPASNRSSSEYSKSPEKQSHKKSGSKNSGGKLIGTPDYMAPEVINGDNSTGKPIDWWAVGVILYEFLVGIPPFNDETLEKVQDNIKNVKIQWPTFEDGSEYLSPHTRDFIAKLLMKDPAKRLGSNGVEEIKSHPYFKGFDWEDLRDTPAPVKPFVVNETDISNFEKESLIINEEEKSRPFKEKKNTKRRAASAQLDLNNFQMRRKDLLHQLNLQDYDNFMNSTGQQVATKPEEKAKKKLTRSGTANV